MIFKSKPKPNNHKTNSDLVPGRVAEHVDSEGHHTAIILTVGAELCWSLFFTTRPKWSKIYRRATNEELALAGKPARGISYLAPTYRPHDEFQNFGPLFPSHRIMALMDEFGKYPHYTMEYKKNA